MAAGKERKLTLGRLFSRVAEAALVVTDRDAGTKEAGARVRRGTARFNLIARENIVGVEMMEPPVDEDVKGSGEGG